MNNEFKSELIEFINLILRDRKQPAGLFISSEEEHEITIFELNITFRMYHLQDLNSKRLTAIREDISHKDNKKTVHIWEDQWMFEKDKIKSKIISLLGVTDRIHGRNTNIVKLDNDQLIHFLINNHLNTPLKAKYKYGLEFEGELVAVMSFSKGRPIKRGNTTYISYELLRFCNKMNVTVVGGFSKLLSTFQLNHKPDDIMTYVDADWSDGNYLKQLGFQCVEYKDPIEFWLNTKTGVREYPHQVLQKYKELIRDESDGKYINQFLFKNGYLRIYNSGSYKYLLKIK